VRTHLRKHACNNTDFFIQTAMRVHAPFLCTWEHVFTGMCVYVAVKFLLLACEANRWDHKENKGSSWNLQSLLLSRAHEQSSSECHGQHIPSWWGTHKNTQIHPIMPISVESYTNLCTHMHSQRSTRTKVHTSKHTCIHTS